MALKVYRTRFITVRHGSLLPVKLVFLLASLCLLLQPVAYVGLYRALWARYFSPPAKPVIPEHIRKLVSVQNATRILDESVDGFRFKNREKIPKIFHQIFANDQIPAVYAPLIRSWMQHHPDYEYWFWDDVSGRSLVKEHYPHFLPLFDAYCHDLFRSDVLRYFFLHRYGGIYIDMDYDCYKNINVLLEDHQCVLVQENAPQAAILYRAPDMVMNAWLASVPKHPYMNFLINLLPSHATCTFGEVLQSTGPLMLYEARKMYLNVTRCNEDEGCFVHVLPSYQMMPQWDGSSMKNFKEKCKKKKMTNLQKEGCKMMAIYNFSSSPPVHNAYASHKFMHLGNQDEKHKLALKKTISISQIIPSVIYPFKPKVQAYPPLKPKN